MRRQRRHRREASWVRRPWWVAVLLSCIGPSAAQAPNASVRGVVADVEARPIVGAKITSSNSETGFAQTTTTDTHGEYYFGSLPRGLYGLKVEAAGYRGLEKQGIELAVGAKDEENFTLASAEAAPGGPAVGGAFQIVPPAPSLPVETIASSVSVVVDESKILELPLANRNIYSLFLLQPGVTSPGAIGSRGLTFSVHGQRVSGSNYQLDGVDNNNIIVTGPVTPISAEAIQEFRMVNSSFSAENGRATSFVADVATRSGSNRFHGSLFEYVGNDKLDANTFENNSKTLAKPPFRQNQFGYSLGGPVQKNRTFFWSGLELSRLRFGTPLTLSVPTATFIASLPADSVARRLLTEIPPYAAAPSTEDPNIGILRFDAHNRIDTLLASQRVDHQFANEKDRLTLRFSLASTSEQRNGEDIFTVGYPSLVPTDHSRAYNTMVAWTHSFNSGRVNDFRVGWSREQIDLPRPRSEVAMMTSPLDHVLLPGSPRQSDVGENNNVIQISDRFSMLQGRSALTMGFEYRRNLSNSISLGLEGEAFGNSLLVPDGFYFFPNLESFGAGQSFVFSIDLDRNALLSGVYRLPNLHRRYRSNEFASFIQDDIRVSSRFSLNLGLRYEYYGVPYNTDSSKDVNFYFGPGSTVEEKLANGALRSTDQNPGDLKGKLYRPDRLNFAPSIGIAWDPLGRGRTVVRAGYAIAFDRVFDTIRDLRSNSLQTVTALFPPLTVPTEDILPLLSGFPVQISPQAVVQLDENLRTPYAENWYVGVQQTVTPNFLVEIGHVGSVGRKLISRDVINRSLNGVRPGPSIADDTYLSNAGNSNYLALQVGLRRRFSRGLQFQASYTWGHAIDNQSDTLEGALLGPQAFAPATPAFTRALDPRVDRGNANFDQRQNLIFNAIWNIPSPLFRERWQRWFLMGWTASVIGAYRSGFPVTVIGYLGEDPTTGLFNNRADFVAGQPELLSAPTPVPGGVQWLNPNAFQQAAGGVGALGRGAIAGPGFWNYDFAVLHNIPFSESTRLQLRAEFYNLFNHANLSIPISKLGDPNFGQAYYGLDRTFSRFGDLPLEDTARRIQLALRLVF
jgi:hypothetical protein